MSSSHERSRNNVRAGILVTVTLALAFAVIVVLQDAMAAFDIRSSYVIRFPIGVGVEGLSPGSEVKIGGVRGGAISSIYLTGTGPGAGGPMTHIEVEIEIDRQIVLYPNASPTKEVPLLGNAGWINFESVGDPSGGAALAPGDSIEAVTGAGLMARMIAPGQLARISHILDNLDAIIADARRDYATHIGPSAAHLEQALADAAQLVSSVRNDYGDWRLQIASSLESAASASAKIDSSVDEATGLVHDAREGVASARSILDDNRPSIDAIVGNIDAASADVRAIAARVSEHMLDRVDALLASGQDGLAAFTGLVGRLETELDLAAPRLQSSVADAQLMAQQLKLASIEIRRSPWRLLYRPSSQELEHELLYEAARSFALAAGDLQGTAATLDRVLERHSQTLATDPELAGRVRLMLDQSFRRYEQAQQVLFTILMSDEK